MQSHPDRRFAYLFCRLLFLFFVIPTGAPVLAFAGKHGGTVEGSGRRIYFILRYYLFNIGSSLKSSNKKRCSSGRAWLVPLLVSDNYSFEEDGYSSGLLRVISLLFANIFSQSTLPVNCIITNNVHIHKIVIARPV